jgi:hypothetical protein
MSRETEKWLDRIPSYPDGIPVHADNEFFLKSIGPGGKHMLVAELDDQILIDQLPTLKGIDIDISQPKANKTLLSITLQESEHLDKFALLSLNIAQRTSHLAGKDLILHTLKILKSWSKLLSPSRSRLSDSELIGLIGELYLLNKYVLEIIPPQLSIRAWIGPEDAKQDIVADNFSIEVKAHHAGFSNKISISSAEQLTMERENLFLYKADFSPSDKPEAHSLQSLKEAILEKIQFSDDAYTEFLMHFDEKTEKASENQLITAYLLLNDSIYIVDEAFPKITQESIPNGVISDSVKYSLDVEHLKPWLSNKSLMELIQNV